MKKVFVFAIGFAMAIMSTQDANAWGWKKESVDCTVTKSYDFIFYEYSESYAGTKNVCRDGDDWWCRSTYCG